MITNNSGGNMENDGVLRNMDTSDIGKQGRYQVIQYDKSIYKLVNPLNGTALESMHVEKIVVDKCDKDAEIAELNATIKAFKVREDAMTVLSKMKEIDAKAKDELLEKFREAFKFYDPYNHRGNREQWESLSGEALALLSKSLNKEEQEKGSEE